MNDDTQCMSCEMTVENCLNQKYIIQTDDEEYFQNALIHDRKIVRCKGGLCQLQPVECNLRDELIPSCIECVDSTDCVIYAWI